MEMFVGVGASRVRDLFQSARKMGRAIIFIDEIDSIGRKRGAGLGGGHDEREQTLNQMLVEMDGFETTEGIVIMAATNRPDILDPALLRPGRFDRQVVVPAARVRRAARDPQGPRPSQADRPRRRPRRRGPGTPGMSGADLANLVNEAALFAVRRGADADRQRTTSSTPATACSWAAPRVDGARPTEEKRDHRLPRGRPRRAAPPCSPHGDPLHKVTILPRGMALGVTQTLRRRSGTPTRRGVPRGPPS